MFGGKARFIRSQPTGSCSLPLPRNYGHPRLREKQLGDQQQLSWQLPSSVRQLCHSTAHGCAAGTKVKQTRQKDMYKTFLPPHALMPAEDESHWAFTESSLGTSVEENNDILVFNKVVWSTSLVTQEMVGELNIQHCHSMLLQEDMLVLYHILPRCYFQMSCLES